MSVWGDYTASVYRAAKINETVTFTERDGTTAHTETDCQVQWRTVHGFSSGGALTSSTVPEVVIPRVAANVKPESSWTGTAGTVRFTVGTVAEAPGHWTVSA